MKNRVIFLCGALFCLASVQSHLVAMYNSKPAFEVSISCLPLDFAHVVHSYRSYPSNPKYAIQACATAVTPYACFATGILNEQGGTSWRKGLSIALAMTGLATAMRGCGVEEEIMSRTDFFVKNMSSYVIGRLAMKGYKKLHEKYPQLF